MTGRKTWEVHWTADSDGNRTSFHVIPKNDDVPHSVSPECACRPWVASTRPDGIPVYSHEPADGRPVECPRPPVQQ